MIDIEKVDLLNKVLDMKNAGYRLAQMCATKLQNFILLYSFVKDEKLVTLRFNSDIADTVESVSWIYSYAFLYENEMKDLFGVNVLNMNLDFHGHFYETAVKTPFNPTQAAVSENKESEANSNG
ncbi:MAG: NADH-quinone oxidoreductase subunit C [Oscillospiraceae bacterium]|nr:NADH-quinone oxidoreductase subunit C [Oscillospiraceae bacterium]